MKRILIDTNIYVAFKRNVKEIIEVLRTVDYIGMNTVVLGELYAGFKGGVKEEKNKEELDKFLDSPRVEVLPVDEATSEVYAHIFWNLRKKGQPIPTNDIWIAASAFQHNLALFTLDDHYNKVDGLIIQ
ncbi:MAG: type II toxin-antitoxin system VapC family toxin [Pseudomonadota bacterium]